jgi:uncharacterized membrane protein YadS
VNNKWVGLIVGLIIIFVLAWCSWQGSVWAVAQGAVAKGFWADMSKALEYPLWAAVLGLIANFVLGALKLKDFIKPGIRTELFLKIGLVLLGTTININTVLRAGGGGVIQGIFMVTSVFFFSWWLSGVFKLPDTLRAVMSTAIAVCGVSAAIAAAGSVLAKKEELAYVTALVIVTALPLMVLMPYCAQALGLTPTVAGAWFGGNIDTTAAVVGAGTIYGPKAQEIASIVKMSQNALIGLVAFLLAFYFVSVVEKGKERPSAKVIWDRFPKFVLGFIVASLLVSIVDAKGASVLFSADALAAMSNLRNWFFCLAFVCIGLELDFSQIKQVGGGPFWCYMIVTVFNTVLALIVAMIIFGWLMPI